MIGVPPFRLFTCLILLQTAQLGHSECGEKPNLGKGDWKKNVLSTEGRVRMLEAELMQSLREYSDCEEQGSAQSQSQDNSAANGKLDGTSSAGAQNSVTSPSKLPEERQSGGEDDSSDTADSIVKEESIPNQRGDESLKESPVDSGNEERRENSIVSQEDELRRVLQEAIKKEKDAAKRQALIDRYEDLFGPFVTQ